MRVALLVILLCSACATPSVLVKQNIIIHKLGICFDTGQHASPLITNQFNYKLDEFILKYNSDPRHPFELFRASPTDSSTLRIRLMATRMVSEGDQVAGALVSLVGFSIPFIMIGANAPIIVFFYYFPQVRSLTELSLSEDINEIQTPRREFVLASPGFLKSPEKQLEKHAISFDHMLGMLITQIEKQVRVAAKRRASVASGY